MFNNCILFIPMLGLLLFTGVPGVIGCKETPATPMKKPKIVEPPKQSRVTTLPYYKDASFTPHWHKPNDEALKAFHQIPDFELTNQKGQVVSEKTFEGKIYVTDFFFTTCPGICLDMTKNMLLIQKAFQDDPNVLLLSHSVTPKEDTVEVLNAYGKRLGVNSSKWHLVTGSRQTIYNLGRKSYFIEEDLGKKKSNDDFLHTENFVLVDKHRRIRGIYNGLNANDIKQLIADVKTLKREG